MSAPWTQDLGISRWTPVGRETQHRAWHYARKILSDSGQDAAQLTLAEPTGWLMAGTGVGGKTQCPAKARRHPIPFSCCSLLTCMRKLGATPWRRTPGTGTVGSSADVVPPSLEPSKCGLPPLHQPCFLLGTLPHSHSLLTVPVLPLLRALLVSTSILILPPAVDQSMPGRLLPTALP